MSYLKSILKSLLLFFSRDGFKKEFLKCTNLMIDTATVLSTATMTALIPATVKNTATVLLMTPCNGCIYGILMLYPRRVQEMTLVNGENTRKQYDLPLEQMVAVFGTLCYREGQEPVFSHSIEFEETDAYEDRCKVYSILDAMGLYTNENGYDYCEAGVDTDDDEPARRLQMVKTLATLNLPDKMYYVLCRHLDNKTFHYSMRESW